jgi:hypothetical protein
MLHLCEMVKKYYESERLYLRNLNRFWTLDHLCCYLMEGLHD